MASLVESIGWHEWLCHSNFSFLIGASHPKELILKASAFGYRGIGVADFDGVYGIARFFRERKKLLKSAHIAPLRLYYGAEVHLTADHHLPVVFQDTVVLMAQTHQGYYHLCQILNAAHQSGKHDAHIPIDVLLASDVTGIVAIQPMRGYIRTVRHLDNDAIHDRYGALKDHFQGRYYFAVSRHMHPSEDHWMTPTIQLATDLNCPIILSQDIFFHEARRKPLSDVLAAIRHNCHIHDTNDHLFATSYRRPLPIADIERLYGPLPIFKLALESSAQLADCMTFDLHELTYQYPKEMIPATMTAKEYLTSLSWEKATAYYTGQIPSDIQTRIKTELALIEKLNFADYFLTVFDIVSWARSQGILCQGRGSAANSAVCFVLGITSVNPKQFDLLFERFINCERGDPPDIDVDFEHERREEVIQYIYTRYGRDRAAMVANVITFKSKGALRFTGKALGIPEPVLSKASKLISTKSHRRRAISEVVAAVREAGIQGMPDHLWTLWAQMASEIRGFPRHLGIHSGGFVVSDKPIAWLCAQEPATMTGRTVITWCKEDIEGLNFFKIDILALGGLTLIQKCFKLIKSEKGIDLSMDRLPMDDAKTYAMIQKADTVGTFQIESRAQMSFLPRHKPENFYDLVVQVAIIRPGPIQGGMIHPYLKRRHGHEAVSVPDPRLEPILTRTYGVPIFQEQVMRIAMAVGEFSAGEADALRRNIGAFGIQESPHFWIEKLVAGMRKNNISEPFITSILGHIKGFSSYGFPESHAASFALLAYATAYLKCHYPAEFFTAILNAQPMGFYVPDTLIKTAQRSGVKVRPICIGHSEWDHTIEEGEIRLGFRLIRGLSESRMQAAITHRHQQPGGAWPTMGDFLSGAKLNRSDITALAAANALAGFGLDRRAALWLAEAVPYSALIDAPETPIDFEPETPWESVQLDYRATETSLGQHPAQMIKQYAWVFPVPVTHITPADQVQRISRNKRITVFGMVTSRQAPPTAKGMMFLTLWDETGPYNLVVRPAQYDRYHALIDGQTFMCVKGVVQTESDARSILVQHIYAPVVPKAKVLPLDPPGKLLDMPWHPIRNYN